MKKLFQHRNFEFRSKEEISGWPLIHINIGTDPVTGRPLVAKGVVAIGNIAVGIVSIGAAAFGIVTLAALGMGVVSLAAFAIGIIALGAVALGYEYALGVGVLSDKLAIGVIDLNADFLVGSVLFAASIVLIAWSLGKVKTARLQH